MHAPKIGSKSQPFPLVRPAITVTPSRARPFPVDCRCMPGWGVPLEVGATSWMSWYDPPDWRLTSVSFLHAVQAAEIHGLECVQVDEYEWEASHPQWRRSSTSYSRLTQTAFEWLADARLSGGKWRLRTFLDDGFDRDWGASPRLLKDTGRLVAGKDGTYTLKARAGESGDVTVGSGVFRVGVGRRRFACLRAVSLYVAPDRGKAALEQAMLVESFYTRQGRLVLFRRYNGRLWRTQQKGSPYGKAPWDQRFPNNARLVINGAMFVHWYDCLTDIAVGLGR